MARAADAGFSLIEVLVATALFVLVSLAGFEILRQLGGHVELLAQRNDSAAQLDVAASALRSTALSAAAVWKPASACGDAVEFMARNAGGVSFALYLMRDGALVRANSSGPLDPCAASLQTSTVVASIVSLRVARIAAPALAAHTDPVSGNVDGGLILPGGVTPVAVDAHVSDAGGSHITAGNDVVEVTIDADPAQTTLDLLAGNRPSAYTQVLSYACNGRCEAGGLFPEIRNAAFTDCVPGYDFRNSAAYYVPAGYAYIGPSGAQHLVVTAYSVTGGYTFAFGGPAPITVERTWPIATWPPAASPLAGTIADPYPVDYANNAIASRGAAAVAADLGEPAAFDAQLAACIRMYTDPTFDD